MAYFRVIPSWVWLLVGCLLGGLPQLAFADYLEVTGVTSSQATMQTANAGLLGRKYDGAHGAGVYGYLQGVYIKPTGCITIGGISQRPGDGAPTNGSVPASGTARTYTLNQQYVTCPAGSNGNSVGLNVTLTARTGNVCAEGEALNSAGVCVSVCQPGYTWSSALQTCTSPCTAKAGLTNGGSNDYAVLDTTSMSGSTSFCSGGCVAKGQSTECEASSGINATGDTVALGTLCTVRGPFVYTGEACGAGTANPNLMGVENTPAPWWQAGNDPKDCSAQGGYWGTVGTTEGCVRNQEDTNVTKTTTGTKEGTSETSTAPDGTSTETTKTESTECSGATCKTTTTTTTTTKDASGNPTGTETSTSTKEEPKSDYCKSNPTDASCAGEKKDGQFAGTCDNGFTCTGDAVQCAVAEASWKSACALRDSGGGTLAEQIIGGDDPAQMPWAEGAGEQKNVSGLLDTTEHFAASCPPDLSFSINGHSVVVPMTTACNWLGWIGNIMLAGAMLAGLAIALGRPQ